MSDTARHDFKRIEVQTWLAPDEQTLLWMQMTSAAKTPDAWVTFFSQPKLNANAPIDILTQFEVARGSLIYGWFFYPLLTLGASQCWRVMEAATRLRCQQAGIPTKKMNRLGKEVNVNFNDNIAALVAKGLIPQQDESRWHAVRSLRNATSHSEGQMILDPGQAQGILEMSADFVNGLFP